MQNPSKKIKDIDAGRIVLVKLDESFISKSELTFCVCVGPCMFFQIHTEKQKYDVLQIHPDKTNNLDHASYIKYGIVIDLDPEQEIVREKGNLGLADLTRLCDAVGESIQLERREIYKIEPLLQAKIDQLSGK